MNQIAKYIKLSRVDKVSRLRKRGSFYFDCIKPNVQRKFIDAFVNSCINKAGIIEPKKVSGKLKEIMTSTYDNFEVFVLGAFPWDKTREDFDYWYDLSECGSTFRSALEQLSLDTLAKEKKEAKEELINTELKQSA